MKIAHVGDVAYVASTLVEGCRAIGHEAELLQLQSAGARYPLPVKALFLPWRLKEGSDINRRLREGRFDVVHLHMAYMGWLGIAGRYPYFLHCHGHDLRRNLQLPILRQATIKALMKAERVYFSTPDLLGYIAPFRPDAVFIPNPINTDLFRPHRAPENSRPRVLLISRLWDIKGPETAFAIAGKVKRERPDVQFDAFSWGPQAGKYSAQSGVNLISTVQHVEMPHLINNYDVVIGQFRLGAMGMSELESMACARPVVSFFRYPHFYDQPPPLYSTDDANAAAQYVLDLLDDPALRSRSGKEGRNWVERYHNYLQVARTLEAEYTSTLITS